MAEYFFYTNNLSVIGTQNQEVLRTVHLVKLKLLYKHKNAFKVQYINST